VRAKNVATLWRWKLTDAQLALEGEHPAFGPVTLRQLLATWVAHDLGTWPRLLASWRSSTARRLARGARTCPSWIADISG
jgi:hypothetical protein